MEDGKRLAIPPVLLTLDAIGVILLTFGVVKHFAGVDIISPDLLFENYGVVFMGLGIAMILPMIFHILFQIREISENERNN